MKSLTEAQLRKLLETAYARGASDHDEMQQFLERARRQEWEQKFANQKAIVIADRREQFFDEMIKAV